MRLQRWTLLMLLLCSVTAVLPKAAMAEWPERAVKIVVTFPPGSANDAAARIFADGLSKRWGKPVIVEDRTGAEGTIGVGAFVSAQDDHTLLYTVIGSTRSRRSPVTMLGLRLLRCRDTSLPAFLSVARSR
jgi:tripartite-type tricarboxylate transporter receptor subunit TctC